MSNMSLACIELSRILLARLTLPPAGPALNV